MCLVGWLGFGFLTFEPGSCFYRCVRPPTFRPRIVLPFSVLSSATCPLFFTSLVRIQYHRIPHHSQNQKNVYPKSWLMTVHWHFCLFATKAAQALWVLKTSTVPPNLSCVLAPVGSARPQYLSWGHRHTLPLTFTSSLPHLPEAQCLSFPQLSHNPSFSHPPYTTTVTS